MLRSPIGNGLLALMATLLPANAADAQPRLRFDAALEVGQVYDDNLFPDPTSSVRETDVIHRMTPRLRVAYTGRTLRLLARYGRDAEVFDWHPELNSTRARQDAALEVGWSPARALTLAAGISYADTTTARDLNLIAPLETLRVPAERLSTRASSSLRVGARTRVRAEQGFDRERARGFPEIDTYFATVALERRFGAAETADLSFGLREFASAGSVMTSYVLALAWSRPVTARSSFELMAGPRLTDDGGVGPEISLGVRSRLRHGEIVLEYARTEATAAGHLGRLNVERVSATLRHHVSSRLTIRGGPAVATSRRGRTAATIYVVGAELQYRLTQRAALAASHTWSLQQGNLAGPAARDIPHNIISLKLVARSAGG